jgi:hypothetical protein
MPEIRVGTARRSFVIGCILLLLALAGFANASVKRHRDASASGPSAAVSAAQTSGGATSSAWYCAGPLPLGLRSEHARIAVANISPKVVHGELLVATETGVARAEHLAIAAHGAISLAVASPGHSAFGAASVLLDGAGVGVEELITGPTGTDASPCVSHATAVQYLPGGATKDGSTIDLAVFDPGATPSVASVTFATATGTVAPPAFQQMPIEAGETLVLDVDRYLPLQPILATTVTAAGGRVVVGAIASSPVGKVVYPSLVAASAVPETSWYFGPSPSGPSARQGFVVLNPGSNSARVSLSYVGTSGQAELAAVVPAGGVIELAPPSDKSATGSRWASISASQPIVATRETVLGPAPSTTSQHIADVTRATTGPAVVLGLPNPLPSGFSLTPGSLVLVRSWLLVGGESTSHGGEQITVANPSAARVTVRLVPLAGRVPATTVAIGPHGAAVLGLPATSADPGELSAEVDASAPVVVGAVLYARRPKGSSGFSAPGAIPID